MRILQVACLGFDDRGRRLLVGDSLGRITVVDAKSCKRVKSLDPHATGPVLWVSVRGKRGRGGGSSSAAEWFA